jgi:hypothetical protein
VVTVADRVVAEAVERSADPTAAERAIERVTDAHHGVKKRLREEPALLAALVAVGAASPNLVRVLATDRTAVDVLAHLDERPSIERS